MSEPDLTLPDLPPRRPMPPDVRERLRRGVLGTGRARAPLAAAAAAAAVAALAAGGVIFTQSVQFAESNRHHDTGVVGPPTSPSVTVGAQAAVSVVPKATGDDAARCGFPPADVRFTIGLPGRRILVTGADRFCEITYTSITHDKPGIGPVPVAGSAASLLWSSGSGVIVGRKGPGTSRVEAVTGAQVGVVLPVAVSEVEDLFVIPQSATWMVLTFTTPSGPAEAEISTAALPDQASWSVRQDAMPPGDPAVAQCLDESMRDGESWVGDPLRWRPGAATAADVNALLVMHDGAGRTAYCQVYHGRGSSAVPEDDPPHQGDAMFRLRHVTGYASDPSQATVLLGGTVDTTQVIGVEVTDPQGRTAQAVLRDGTFAARLDGQPPFTARSLTKGFVVRVLFRQNVSTTFTLE
ncbi:hypothetical protein AB0K14_40235 [Actinosynnema sp. NPDC050801]|uniref:hypothetical protein n=1 Tax=unclassified Actinosynnema TaxID=2637065 RepID=UPI0033E43738